jgi:hypothetical protein
VGRYGHPVAGMASRFIPTKRIPLGGIYERT